MTKDHHNLDVSCNISKNVIKKAIQKMKIEEHYQDEQ